MATWRKVTALVLATALTACTRPYKTPRIESLAPAQSSFDGLRDIASGAPLKVLVVHGMCSHDFTWVSDWRASMAKSFGSKGVGQPSDPSGMIQTARYAFDDHGRKVEVTFAVWSLATHAAKISLDYDAASDEKDRISARRQGAIASSYYDADLAHKDELLRQHRRDTRGEFRFKRAKVNSALKTALINDCFSDAVIYAGSLAPNSLGDSIRQDMSGLVCSFLGGSWSNGTCTGGESTSARAYIAESLGSKILVDAVNRLTPRGVAHDPALRSALGNTRAIYMLANQLPLLRLAEIGAPDQERAPDLDLRYFGSAKTSSLDDAGKPPLQLVAFTDPNDLLSYRLTYDSIGESPKRVALFNVIVSNAPTYLGLAEHPWTAHTGYWDNNKVPPLVLEGGAADQ